MALILTLIAPTESQSSGGTLIDITGDFSGLEGVFFRVYVGPNGDATDPQCYSGIVDQGNLILPLNSTTLRCYLPDVPDRAAAYPVFVQKADLSDSGTLAASMIIFPDDFKSSVFDFRSVLPPLYKMGARNLTALAQVVELP